MTGVSIIETSMLEQLFDKLDQIEKHIAEKHIADPWMSIEQVAEYTGFGRRWVSDRIKAREIAYTYTGEYRIRKSAIDAYMKDHEVQPKTK
jgi:excisionase family DNA binding protein